MNIDNDHCASLSENKKNLSVMEMHSNPLINDHSNNSRSVSDRQQPSSENMVAKSVGDNDEQP